jgi:hypothetical protein
VDKTWVFTSEELCCHGWGRAWNLRDSKLSQNPNNWNGSV